MLVTGVHDEHRFRNFFHVLDAAQKFIEAQAVFFPADSLFLGQKIVCAVLFHAIEFNEAGNRVFNGGEVGESAPEPAHGDVRHVHSPGLLGDDLLCLGLGAHEQHVTALGGHLFEEVHRFLEKVEGFLEIDDVDPVSRPENIGLHLGVPAVGLVAEMRTGFEQFPQRDSCQEDFLLIPP